MTAMGTDILNEDFDVFIAYHGTNDIKGSLKMAEYVYNQLSQFAKCFFMPISSTIGFTDTPTVDKHSKLFILVANDSIPLNNKGEIKGSGLRNEIQAFYDSHFDFRAGDYARVFACDGLTAKKADSFHVLFGGHPHFEDSIPNSIDKLIDWVRRSLAVSPARTSGEEQNLLSVQQKNSEINYEGMWVVTGEFNLFLGETDSFTSVGRLLLQRSTIGYKALYCYGVSREYTDQNCVTAICDGSATVGQIDGKNEALHLTCDIIARTSDECLHGNKHFRMTLIPQSCDVMTADFITKKTKGKIVFTRKE